MTVTRCQLEFSYGSGLGCRRRCQRGRRGEHQCLKAAGSGRRGCVCIGGSSAVQGDADVAFCISHQGVDGVYPEATFSR